MTDSHQPVLLKELLSLFPEANPPLKILDCTFGRGGHSRALLNKYPQSSVLALDRDKEAIEFARSLKETQNQRLSALHENFHDFPKKESASERFDLIVMDLGVSSPQLDTRERGFSFYKEGPLDMRMDQSQNLTAEDIVNSHSKKDLIDLFKSYGEIKRPYHVVDDILKARKQKRIQTTLELAQIIKSHSPPRFHKHPATPWFLALRIAVNQELEGLKACLPLYVGFLKPKGFLAVISFHSLEDRIVKQHFKAFVKEQKGQLYSKKAIQTKKEERRQNPRSRSAKLRIFQRLS